MSLDDSQIYNGGNGDQINEINLKLAHAKFDKISLANAMNKPNSNLPEDFVKSDNDKVLKVNINGEVYGMLDRNSIGIQTVIKNSIGNFECDTSSRNLFYINNVTSSATIVLTNISNIGQSGKIIIYEDEQQDIDITTDNGDILKWYGGVQYNKTTIGKVDVLSYFILDKNTVLMDASIGYS